MRKMWAEVHEHAPTVAAEDPPISATFHVFRPPGHTQFQMLHLDMYRKMEFA